MRKRLSFNQRKNLKLSAMLLTGILTVSSIFIQSPVIGHAEDQAASDAQTQNVVTKIPGTVSIESGYNDSFLSITGFASVNGNVKDRSEYVGTEYYRVIDDEKDFLDAIRDAQKGQVKVMEITKDMDLGYKYLTNLLTKDVLRKYNFVREYKKPSNSFEGGFTNPLMAASGVTQISIGGIDGLTIFSPNASSIKHTELKISGNDIVIRNLHFKEMWQWDDDGAQKEVGWTNMKLNGCTNVWVDHCTFEIASDGNIDLENGARGITISWCKIGDEATENPAKDGSIYQSIMFMEDKYQKGELDAEKSLYHQMRTGGATPEQIMAYTAYHKKCHLSGSGDKDFVNYKRSDGTVVEDANSNINLTLAYNHYTNVGQRVPMIRQGVGNLINCYIDDSTHHAAEAANPIFEKIGPYELSRCLNSRNGACIAADTCVFNSIEEPITGAEVQGDDTIYMNGTWPIMFQNVYNHALIVNSTVTNSKGTYTGSSWDNNGDNLFTTGFHYRDKSTVGNWAWASHIVNEDSYEKRDYTVEEAKPMEFTYDTDGTLPYEYKVLPLESVKEVVTGKSGAGSVEMTSADWVKTKYVTDADYSAVDAAIEAAKALNPSDYVDFSGVTAAVNAVERGLNSDNQARVNAMAETIKNEISKLVKAEEPEEDNSSDSDDKTETPKEETSTVQPGSTIENPSTVQPGDKTETPNEDVSAPQTGDKEEGEVSPQTGDNNTIMLYVLLLASSMGLAGIAAFSKRKYEN